MQKASFSEVCQCILQAVELWKKSSNIDGFHKAKIIEYSVEEQAITYASDERETDEERFEYKIVSLFNFDTEEDDFPGFEEEWEN